MPAARVTVLINNYNYSRYLRKAIDSVLTQCYDNMEVLIVDDGSTDDSRAIISSYGGKVRSLFKPNGGQASAFNVGFAASQGTIICLLDSDDWFLPGKVTRVAEVFAGSLTASWVFHRLQTTFADGSIKHEARHPARFVDERQSALQRGKLNAFAPPTSGLCFARSLLDRLLPMPEEIRITSDNYLKLAGMSLAPGVYVDEPLAAQRIHPSNAYTLRPGRLPLQARIHLLIAEALNSRHPELRRLSDRVFAKALADYLAAGNRDADSRAVISRYLKQRSLANGAKILGHAGFHLARQHLLPHVRHLSS